MHRLAPVLLFCGALLFATGTYAPALSTPGADGPATASTIDQVAPVIAAVNAEVARLRARVSVPPAEPDRMRDPFRFGRLAEPTAPPAAQGAVDHEPELPVIDLPRLIAVLELAEGGGVVLSASLGIGDDVRIVRAGDAVGQFRVDTIDARSIVLQHIATQTVHRLSLR